MKTNKVIDGKVYSFFQGPDNKRLQQKMGEAQKQKGDIKSYRVIKDKRGFLLYVR